MVNAVIFPARALISRNSSFVSEKVETFVRVRWRWLGSIESKYLYMSMEIMMFSYWEMDISFTVILCSFLDFNADLVIPDNFLQNLLHYSLVSTMGPETSAFNKLMCRLQQLPYLIDERLQAFGAKCKFCAWFLLIQNMQSQCQQMKWRTEKLLLINQWSDADKLRG